MSIVRIPINKARESGKYDQYRSVAIDETDTHLRIKESDWRRIKQADATGIMPSVVRRVAHGAAGLLKSTVGVGSAPPEVVASRLAICGGCEHSSPADKPVEQRRCGKLTDVLKPAKKTCGCGLARKTGLQSEACPLGKW